MAENKSEYGDKYRYEGFSEDIYDRDDLAFLMENDEISSQEEAFMIGCLEDEERTYES